MALQIPEPRKVYMSVVATPNRLADGSENPNACSVTITVQGEEKDRTVMHESLSDLINIIPTMMDLHGFDLISLLKIGPCLVFLLALDLQNHKKDEIKILDARGFNWNSLKR